MKKIIYIIIPILIVLCVFVFFINFRKSDIDDLEKNISKMDLYGDLVTLETYYHNVANYDKKAGSGITHWFEKDRKLWIEYTGIVKLGIDMSSVKIDTKGDRITVFVPKAKIIGKPTLLDEDFTKASFIDSEDGLNKNELTTEDATKAMEFAQNTMQNNVRNDSQLLNLAQKRAKNLIEEYINQFSGISNTLYSIEWEYEANK